MGKTARFRGVVFSGLGEGSFYVSIYTPQFRRALGIRPYPGTLNIRIDEASYQELDRCLSLIRPIRVSPPKLPGARLGGVLAYPARVNGYDVFIVRPEITVYKRGVVEVIAEKYLRAELGVEDGDVVDLEVECDGER